MPFREMSLNEVADYLHLQPQDVETLVKRQEIPHEKRGGRIIFRRAEVDAWASQRILGLEAKPLKEYHARSTAATRRLVPGEELMPWLVKPAYVAPNLKGKTRSSILRELVKLADATGLVSDPEELLKSLEEREALCPTGLPGGLAVPHPRHHLPYMFTDSFLLVARSVQDIPFGAPDGEPTRLFFLLACQDERLHLHTLARICLMAQKTGLVAQLLEAPDAETMYQSLVACEKEALQLKND
ncbi:MAG: PTS sugar transporter subunit IIA [Verrucomicrobiae bacterium]|nr:PTS sugar transporter subunit IIA [Verrucomicrobiae bacterium]